MTETIMLAGDIHGSARHLIHGLLPEAKKEGCSRIIALGDFGFFWATPTAAKTVAKQLEDEGIELWFLDGNHENFWMMETYGFDPNAGTDPVTNSDLPNLTYLPRGSTFEWGGKTFMAFGGAVSIDKAQRTEGSSWWPEELITEGQVRRVEDSGVKVDILLSHDVPEGVPILEDYLHNNDWHMPYKLDQLSRQNRAMMGRVFYATEPKAVYHGHYHYAYKDKLHGADVTGLACNGMPRSCVILSSD